MSERLTGIQFAELEALREVCDIPKLGRSFGWAKWAKLPAWGSLLRRKLVRWHGERGHSDGWRWTYITDRGREALKRAPPSVRKAAKAYCDRLDREYREEAA